MERNEPEVLSLDEVEIDGGLPEVCQWFLNCEETPTHLVSHSILGWVPACERCAAFVVQSETPVTVDLSPPKYAHPLSSAFITWD